MLKLQILFRVPTFYNDTLKLIIYYDLSAITLSIAIPAAGKTILKIHLPLYMLPSHLDIPTYRYSELARIYLYDSEKKCIRGGPAIVEITSHSCPLSEPFINKPLRNLLLSITIAFRI